MQIGYARVSTDDQDTAVQVAALKSAGCERIYKEKASGGRWDRPELHRLLDQLRKGDVLVGLETGPAVSAPSAMYSLSWSGSANPGRASAV